MGGKKKEAKLTLETYMNVARNPSECDLTRNQLNQIINMHGFFKLYHSPKSVLIDRVNKIEILSPIRSTLNEKIYPSRILNLMELTEDLSTLQWNECSVQSVKTVRSGTEDLCSGELTGKRKRKRKLKSANEMSNAVVFALSAPTSSNCSALSHRSG